MIKILKWIYGLGIKAERRRIKLLVAEYRQKKPEPSEYAMNDNREMIKEYERSLQLWYGVSNELEKITNPTVFRETELTSLIDEDE